MCVSVVSHEIRPLRSGLAGHILPVMILSHVSSMALCLFYIHLIAFPQGGSGKIETRSPQYITPDTRRSLYSQSKENNKALPP